MKRNRTDAALVVLAGLVTGGGIAAWPALVAPPVAAAAEMALCVVCQAKEGEASPEEVVAWRTFEGKRYGFCSEGCAKEFDADPASFLPPVLPRPAPELGLVDLSGAPLTLAALAGRFVLVDFWATWCKPCAKTMPGLQSLHDKYGARGFTVVGVSIDEGDARGKVTKFLAKKKLTYPNGLDGGKAGATAWERWNVKAVPAAFLLDREGRIVAQWTGAADAAAIEKELAARLDDKPSAASPRVPD